MIDLSIVVPIYNEEDTLHQLRERLFKMLDGLELKAEVVLVNDGSSDRSIEIIKTFAREEPRLRFIDFSRNFGQQIAIFAGLEATKGERVVIMDGDLQDPPELIPALYEKACEGYEVVYAKRKSRKGVGIFKKISYATFYRILGKITEIDIPLDTGDFRIIDRKIIKVIESMPEQPKFLRGQIAWAGFKQVALEYDRDERGGGEPGYTFMKLLKLALDGITGFSDLPLKMATVAGFVVSSVAFVVALYTIYARFFSENYIQGWSSTMVSILFLGGIQLIGIGVIGEYISRLSSNVRKRPLYIVRDSNLDESEKETSKDASIQKD